MGMILGTAAYMSPEQARGRAVDKRADIWAFGVVFYEMLTGTRLFSGEDVSDTMAAVLRQTITFGTLPEQTPPAVRVLIERCLERDIRQRLRDIGEVRVSLERMLLPGGGSAAMRLGPRSVGARARTILPWLLFATTAAALAAVFSFGRRRRLAVRPPSRVFGPASACRVRRGRLWSRGGPLSDGRTIVLRVRHEGTTRLYARRLDQIAPVEPPGASKPPIRFFLPMEARLDSSRPGRSRRCLSREGP